MSSYLSIFNIDSLGNRWGARILFLVTLVLNAAVHFNPWADPDFSAAESWLLTYSDMTEYDPEVYNTLLSNFPLSKGNLIYILTIFAGYMILLIAAYIYAALYVREYRKAKIASLDNANKDVIDYAVSMLPEKPLTHNEIAKKVLIISLFSIAIFFPVAFVVIYFSFIVLFGLPFVFTAPVAYLSGDKGFFKSLPYSVRLSRRYYFVNARYIAVIILVFLVSGFTVPFIAKVSYTAYYIVDAAVSSWLCLSFARLAAVAYCNMKDYPIKGSKRPFAI